MSTEQDPDPLDEDGYDEEADSDFHADAGNEEDLSSSSDEGWGTNDDGAPSSKRKKATEITAGQDAPVELDSGDEATIKEQKKTRRKQRKKGEDVDGETDNEDSGWRAKTRAMREQEKEEKKRGRLANTKGSTIDVDKIWVEMNKPGPLPPLRIEGDVPPKPSTVSEATNNEQNKENVPALNVEEMVTIKRKFKFAGEVHVEEKTVPKSSAEARLWLAQQEAKPQPEPVEEGGVVTQRPLRKVSRFDPNYSNMDAFKMNWTRTAGNGDLFKGPKLNVVEKSKMDWASHVDAEGLKDELDEHAKAKEGYHGRMDFLSQVEQRKEEEARLARLKG